MYSTENYILGWIAYSAGVLCLLSLFWLLIRTITVNLLKHMLLLFSVILFFTPVTAHPNSPYWAPAFFVSIYEGIMLGDQGMGFQRGLAPILAIGFIIGLAYLLLYLIFGRRRH